MRLKPKNVRATRGEMGCRLLDPNISCANVRLFPLMHPHG